MCELCEENNGEPVSCQDCGRLICFDHEGYGDDVMDAAYVTGSGDLFCRRCGSQYDEIDEEWDQGDGWLSDYPESWYDPDCDTGLEESTHRYIGEDVQAPEEDSDEDISVGIWLSELLEPIPGYPSETHCLHVKTPAKEVVFGINARVMAALAALAHIVYGYSLNQNWLDRIAEVYRHRAKR